MKIVVSGSTGLVGSALTPVLASLGHEILPLVRRRPAPGERVLAWDPERAMIDRDGLEGIDVVIHLAGEKVFGRWSPAKKQGIRDVNMRFGVVLTTAGGALAKMLPAFRLGLGGRVGSGNQYLSWITLDDILNAIVHILATSRLAGPVNLTAPSPVTNREFTRTLGKVLGRPALLPVPGFALRVAF